MTDSHGISRQPVVKLEHFPFFVGMLRPDQIPDIPDDLPLHLYVDERLAIPRLVRTPEIENALVRAYEFGSMLSTPLGESSLSKDRMEEFLAGLTRVFGKNFSGRRFVEVGAGNGELLNRVRQLGAEVIGFEIGPQAVEAQQRFDLPVIQASFSAGLLSGNVDCIYSYGLLEHVFEPQDFIDQARNCLNPGGLFFHSVPNSSLFLSSGNVEGLCHEHVNYFTPDNARRLLASRGFASAGTELTRAGNEMQIFGFFDPQAFPCCPGGMSADEESERKLLRHFSALAEDLLEKYKKLFRGLLTQGKKVCFYAGGHILAYLANIGTEVCFSDGDEAKWGMKWLKSLPAVEQPAALIVKDIDIVVVFSEHYLQPIRSYLRNTVGLPEYVEIICLSEMIKKV